MDLSKVIRDIPDFPVKGIQFKDITPVLQNIDAFKHSLDELENIILDVDFDVIVAIESRGFLFGAPLADRLDKPLSVLRKPGKLPAAVVQKTYKLEYGEATLEIHNDALKPGDKCLLVDDLLATGGTVAASAALCEELGGVVTGCLFLVELCDLPGSEALSNYPIFSLVKYGKDI
ncbi:MAG: adenine phosphoribosyltransferase [bacterium]|nr:adenine phosphoribosyltransferase [bacterium]MCP4799580.1 adenine phosphoribosyltransferase [bacterium]